MMPFARSSIGLLGFFHHVRVDLRDRIEARTRLVERRDPRLIQLDEFHGGDLTVFQHFLRLCPRERFEVQRCCVRRGAGE